MRLRKQTGSAQVNVRSDVAAAHGDWLMPGNPVDYFGATGARALVPAPVRSTILCLLVFLFACLFVCLFVWLSAPTPPPCLAILQSPPPPPPPRARVVPVPRAGRRVARDAGHRRY